MAKWPEVRSRCFRHHRQYHHHHRHRHSIRYERRAHYRRIPAGILDAFADFERRVARKNLAFADREMCRKQIGVQHFCEHNLANQAYEVPVNREKGVELIPQNFRNNAIAYTFSLDGTKILMSWSRPDVARMGKDGCVSIQFTAPLSSAGIH